jgi:hypothetical protein
MKWFKRFVLVGLVCLVMINPVMAQDGEVPPEVPTFVEVLGRLAQGLGVGSVLAFLFETVTWFQKLSKQAKWWIVFVTSLTLPVVAQVLLQFVPPEVWATVEPYWHSLALGFLAWSGGQLIHLVDKAVRTRTS